MPQPEDTNYIEDNTRVRHFEVDQNFDDWRLDVFLADRIGSISRTFAAEIITEGDVRISTDRTVKKGMRLQDGEVITVREYLEPEYVQDPQTEIVFKRGGVIIVNKPAGMLCHQIGDTRLNTVNAYLTRQGYEDAKIAHRLDRETSGLVVCGQDSHMIAELHETFRNQSIDKIYRALVVDPDTKWAEIEQTTIDIPLGPDPKSSLPMKKAKGDKEAITHVEPIKSQASGSPEGQISRGEDVSRPPLSDLRVRIETGRQHQIRAHLAMRGTPIAGDKLYNHDDRFFKAISDYPKRDELRQRLIFERQALHARKLRFRHPIDGKLVEVQAALPSIWEKLGK